MSKINDVMQLRADPTPAEWNDVVNKPPHYNQGGMEAIDYIKQQLGEGIVDYCEGNVLSIYIAGVTRTGYRTYRRLSGT